MRKPFIAGNWKMFKTVAEARDFAEEFKKIYVKNDVRVAICVPYTQIAAMAEAFFDTGVEIGAQNMHFEDEGAYTGEISAKMLKELGVKYCIIGHSERRNYFGETDETVNKKLHKASAGHGTCGAYRRTGSEACGSIRADMGNRYGQDCERGAGRRDVRFHKGCYRRNLWRCGGVRGCNSVRRQRKAGKCE